MEIHDTSPARLRQFEVWLASGAKRRMVNEPQRE
jgi:hypothetical protein